MKIETISSLEETINPLGLAFFLILAFMAAGLVQAFWLKSPLSRPFAKPIDGGLTIGGRRLLGQNKTWRGLMAMPLATGVVFWMLSQVRESLPVWITSGMWALPPRDYFWLGLWSGLGFMLGELPNSFMKRRLDIPPGEAPSGHRGALFCFVLDRIDSILGLLITLSLMQTIPWQTWFYLIVLGSLAHWLFSLLFFALKIKNRPA
jgi:hypothetical protein